VTTATGRSASASAATTSQPLPAAGGFQLDQLGGRWFHGPQAVHQNAAIPAASLALCHASRQDAPPHPVARLAHANADRAVPVARHRVFVPLVFLLSCPCARSCAAPLAVPAWHDPGCGAPALVRVHRACAMTVLADPRSRCADPGHSDLARRV
jgi:hypothetical protein